MTIDNLVLGSTGSYKLKKIRNNKFCKKDQ